MNLGKPSPEYFQAATKEFNLPNAQILLISDDPFTDLEGAHELGFKTAFIETGKYKREILAKLKVQPDYLLRDLNKFQDRLAI